MPGSAILDSVDSLPRPVVLAGVFLAGALAGYFDAAAGPRVSLWPLYLVPVAAAAWSLGGRLAVALAIFAAMTSLFDGRGIAAHAPILQNLALIAERAIALGVVAVLVAVLRRARGTLARLEQVDPLTGLENRTSFRKRAEGELNRARRTGQPVTIAFLDCDNFKLVNDTRGHLAGDELLKSIAHVLAAQTRSYDTVARISGDEFLVLLPNTSAESAEIVVRRLQEKLRDMQRDSTVPVTFSIGVAAFTQPPASVDELIHAADVAMYEVKSSTKDGVKFTCGSPGESSSPAGPAVSESPPTR